MRERPSVEWSVGLAHLPTSPEHWPITPCLMIQTRGCSLGDTGFAGRLPIPVHTVFLLRVRSCGYPPVIAQGFRQGPSHLPFCPEQHPQQSSLGLGLQSQM